MCVSFFKCSIFLEIVVFMFEFEGRLWIRKRYECMTTTHVNVQNTEKIKQKCLLNRDNLFLYRVAIAAINFAAFFLPFLAYLKFDIWKVLKAFMEFDIWMVLVASINSSWYLTFGCYLRFRS